MSVSFTVRMICEFTPIRVWILVVGVINEWYMTEEGSRQVGVFGSTALC